MPVNGAAPPGAPRLVEVRLAISEPAARAIPEPRLRRLLELEVRDVGVLAPGTSGPLGDHVAYVWVDQLSPSKMLVEVRLGDRPVGRREIAVLGLAPDVAARAVASAATQLLRAQLQPIPKPAPAPAAPPKPTPAEIERAARMRPALDFAGAGVVAALPQAAGVLGGPSLAAGFRYFGVSEAIFGRWLMGTAGGTSVRWLELGLSAEYRLWLSPSWRLAFGGAGAFSSVRLGDVRVEGGARGDRDTWSVRAGGLVGVEARLAAPLWLALTLEPGAMLRPVRFEDAQNPRGSIEGAWLGASLALHFERVQRP